jgi:hypothetical protein
LDRTLKDVAEQMGHSHACTVGPALVIRRISVVTGVRTSISDKPNEMVLFNGTVTWEINVFIRSNNASLRCLTLVRSHQMKFEIPLWNSNASLQLYSKIFVPRGKQYPYW